MLSYKAFSFFLVFAAAFNPATAAKEATLKLSTHPELRGGSPTPAESLANANADSRMLEVVYPVGFPDANGAWLGDWTGAAQAGLAVHAGAAVVFTEPATTISSGDVCAYAAITGFKDREYVLSDGAIFVNGCNPAAPSLNGTSLVDLLRDALAIQQATCPLGALALVDGELGSRTFLPGAYKSDSAFSVAAGTIVTLKGNAESKFLFLLSGAAVVTGAGTIFNLVPDDKDEEAGRPQAKNILFVSADAATTGAGSLFEGSILSGGAITTTVPFLQF
jgi:hypothetical protein